MASRLTKHFKTDSMGVKVILIAIFLVSCCIRCGEPVGAKNDQKPSSSIHYVRAPARGNGSGSDWANAFKTLPARLVRGHTYYIADGKYDGYAFNARETGSTPIILKKATIGDHGTKVGWRDEFGDGIAEFSGTWEFETGYYEIDGKVGSGTSGYGFKLYPSSCGGGPKVVASITGADHVVIRHTEFQHCGEDQGDSRDDIIYVVAPSNDHSASWLFSHCYMHDTNRTHVLLMNCDNFTFEYCHIGRRHSNGRVHGEAISINRSGSPANHHIRYNTISDIQGTGFIVIKDSVQDHIYIYGNTFYCSSERYNVSNGTICNTSRDTNTYMYIYNNTFVNINRVVGGTGIFFVNGSNNIAYNNLVYNCSRFLLYGIEHDYNWFYNSGPQREPHMESGVENPFVDYANRDYRLAGPTRQGLPLPSPHDKDPGGHTRGADGVWDKGAYEFVAASSEDTSPSRRADGP